jgi:hypothetical protein
VCRYHAPAVSLPDPAAIAAQPKLLRAARTLAVDAVTAEVVATFQRAGIQSILLKGPSIARWLYPRGGRTYNDTDLLIRHSDVPAADEVLRALGFGSILDGWSDAERDQSKVAWTYVRTRALPTAVDLHWSLPQLPDVGPGVLWNALETHLDTLTVAGVHATVLDETALAMHIVLHALQHGHGGHTAEDLRRLVAALPAERWPQVAALALELGIERDLAAGLRLDPGGAAVASALGLADLVIEDTSAWSTAAPRGAVTLTVLSEAPTLRAKLRTVRWVVLPSPAKMRYALGVEARTPWSLLGAYVAWWAQLARDVRKALSYTLIRRTRLKRRST